MGIFIELICAWGSAEHGRGGSRSSRHSTEFFASLGSSDHWAGTILELCAPKTSIRGFPALDCPGWGWISSPGAPGEELVPALLPELCRGRGGGSWAYRALHLEFYHLNPLHALDTLAFRRLLVKSVMEQRIKSPPWPKMCLAAPTPHSASSSSVHCAWGNMFLKKIVIVKHTKDSWVAFPCFPELLKL